MKRLNLKCQLERGKTERRRIEHRHPEILAHPRLSRACKAQTQIVKFRKRPALVSITADSRESIPNRHERRW
jgi:hypothetical protein